MTRLKPRYRVQTILAAVLIGGVHAATRAAMLRAVGADAGRLALWAAAVASASTSVLLWQRKQAVRGVGTAPSAADRLRRRLARGVGRFGPALGVALVAWSALRMRYATLYVRPEMWAEGGENYFYHAHLGGLKEHLVALDYGYLASLPRLAAFGCKLIGLPPRLAPMGYNIIALAFIVVCVAYFCLPRHRLLMASDLCRCLLCFALLAHADYELKTFVNFSYYLMIPVTVALLEAPLRTVASWDTAAICLLATVGMLSKAHFVAFAPAAALLLAYSWRRGRTHGLWLSATLLAAGLVQLVVAALHSSHVDGVRPDSAAMLGRLFVNYCITLIRALVGASERAHDSLAWLGRLLDGHAVPRLAAVGLGLAALLGAVGLFSANWRSNREDEPTRRAVWTLTVSLTTAVSGALLTLVAYAKPYAWHLGAYTPEILVSRHWWMPSLALFLGAGVALAQLLAAGRLRRLLLAPLLLGWLTVSYPFGLHPLQPDPSWPVVGFSSWAGMAPQAFALGRGCVPVDPYPRMVKLGCHLLRGFDNAAGSASGEAVPVPAEAWAAPSGAAAWEVDAVGLLLRGPLQSRRQSRLSVLDAQGRLLGRACAIASQSSEVTYFRFSVPPANVAHLRLEAPSDLTCVRADKGTTTPNVLWLGTGGPDVGVIL